MKNALKIILPLLILLVSCDSSDVDPEFTNKNKALLPKTIKTEQSYDAEPQYDYTHITTFTYDDYNRPLTILKETYRRLNTESKDKDVLVRSISTKLEYSLTEDFVTQTDNIKSPVSEGYDTRIETRVYNIASGGENIIEVTVNGEHKETIELSGGLAVKLNKNHYNGENISPYTVEYKYNKKGDISQYTYISATADRLTTDEKYSYDNYNGVYKHLHIPQWLFIALFNKEGRISNIKEISILNNNKFIPFAKNVIRYNGNGYPQEVVYLPDPEWIGLWGSKTTYEYIEAKPFYID